MTEIASTFARGAFLSSLPLSPRGRGVRGEGVPRSVPSARPPATRAWRRVGSCVISSLLSPCFFPTSHPLQYGKSGPLLEHRKERSIMSGSGSQALVPVALRREGADQLVIDWSDGHR